MRQDRFPIEAARDLLALVRCLYRQRKANGAFDEELKELEEIGSSLRDACELGAKCRPGTLGHQAAWNRAESAARTLVSVVGVFVGGRDLIIATAEKITCVRIGRKESFSDKYRR